MRFKGQYSIHAVVQDSAIGGNVIINGTCNFPWGDDKPEVGRTYLVTFEDLPTSEPETPSDDETTPSAVPTSESHDLGMTE